MSWVTTSSVLGNRTEPSRPHNIRSGEAFWEMCVCAHVYAGAHRIPRKRTLCTWILAQRPVVHAGLAQWFPFSSPLLITSEGQSPLPAVTEDWAWPPRRGGAVLGEGGEEAGPRSKRSGELDVCSWCIIWNDSSRCFWSAISEGASNTTYPCSFPPPYGPRDMPGTMGATLVNIKQYKKALLSWSSDSRGGRRQQVRKQRNK